MDFALFSLDGVLFLLRWFHFFFGVIWIGHLYYFNFTQMPVFGKADAATKSTVIRNIVPEALWWFRWGAMFTMLTGVLILGARGHRDGFGLFATSWGAAILIGTVLGLTMWANVWFVIWPKQKIVMASANQVASGGQALPEAADAGARATQASRTNTLFSIPMLFFMGAASHLPLQVGPEAKFGGLAIVVAIVIGALEVNALKGKKLGPLATVKGVVHMGFVLALALYVITELMLK